MLKIVILAVIVLIAALLGYAATRPDSFAVQRSTTINAPAEKIFPLINDLHGFNRWNPFLKRDPNLKATYTGPAAGPGASYAWEGNKDVGKGRMTVARSTSPSRVEMDLAFIEPIQGDNLAVFTLEPAGSGGTQVTWAMSGKAPFITKLIGVFMPMDKMIGPDFESGLASLKTLAEQPN